MRTFVKSLICIFLLSSCDLFTTIDKEPQNAREFLEQNFEGTFSNERQVNVAQDSLRYDSSKYSSCTLTKFYSSFLQTDVVVVDKIQDKNHKDYSFSTNFLLIQYGKTFTDEIQKLINPDFSDSKIMYDYDWMFSSVKPEEKSKEEFLDYEFFTYRMNNLYILIHVTDEELSDLENRLKSISYRMYIKNQKNDYTRVPVYYYITTPQSRSDISLDYNLITVDDFYTNQKVRQIISKAYKQENLQLEEIQP